MCLEKITKVEKPSLFNLWFPKYRNGYGWKWFDLNNNGSLNLWYFNTQENLLVNKFLDELYYRNHNMPDFYNNLPYELGWHIFLEKPPHWEGSVTKRVRYKMGHTKGIFENNIPSIVAKYMKILEE